jgi:hypothetical protein
VAVISLVLVPCGVVGLSNHRLGQCRLLRDGSNLIIGLDQHARRLNGQWELDIVVFPPVGTAEFEHLAVPHQGTRSQLLILLFV